MQSLLIISLNQDPMGSYGSDHVGGQSKYVLECASFMARRGWRINIVTWHPCEAIITEKLTLDCNVYKFPFPSKDICNYDINAQNVLSIQTDMHEHLINEGIHFDCVLSCYWLSAILGRYFSRCEKVPHIISPCSLGIFRNAAGYKNCADRLKHESDLFKSCDGIIANSSWERNSIISNYSVNADKIVVIPRGIDLRLFNENS